MPAKSKAQQQFMGIVHGLQKGTVKPSDVSPEARKAAKEMDPKDAEKFAKTKHKGLPKHVEKECNEPYTEKIEEGKKYARIVFMQGDEAEEPLDILNRHGESAALKYLLQWDNSDYGDVDDRPGAGTGDRIYKKGDYIMNYNTRIGYIGLERVINEQKENIKKLVKSLVCEILRESSETDKLKQLLSPQEFNIAKDIVDGKKELDDYDDLYEKLFAHWQSEMPYGTQKARTGDPYEWIFKKLDSILG